MFDKGILDRFVNFVGDGAEDSGKAMKRVQNGNVDIYPYHVFSGGNYINC